MVLRASAWRGLNTVRLHEMQTSSLFHIKGTKSRMLSKQSRRKFYLGKLGLNRHSNHSYRVSQDSPDWSYSSQELGWDSESSTQAWPEALRYWGSPKKIVKKIVRWDRSLLHPSGQCLFWEVCPSALLPPLTQPPGEENTHLTQQWRFDVFSHRGVVWRGRLGVPVREKRLSEIPRNIKTVQMSPCHPSLQVLV